MNFKLLMGAIVAVNCRSSRKRQNNAITRYECTFTISSLSFNMDNPIQDISFRKDNPCQMDPNCLGVIILELVVPGHTVKTFSKIYTYENGRKDRASTIMLTAHSRTKTPGTPRCYTRARWIDIKNISAKGRVLEDYVLREHPSDCNQEYEVGMGSICYPNATVCHENGYFCTSKDGTIQGRCKCKRGFVGHNCERLTL